MSESAQAFKWIYAAMVGDSALTSAAVGGVWQGFADIGTTTPYAIVTQQVGHDLITMNARRLFSHLMMQIKAIGPANAYASLVIIADRIDALFGRIGPVSLSPGFTLCSYREQPVAYEELVNGVQFSHLGGLYHILLQGS